MRPTVYRNSFPTHRDWLWPISDAAAIAVAVIVAIFVAYAVGYFNGYDSAMAVR